MSDIRDNLSFREEIKNPMSGEICTDCGLPTISNMPACSRCYTLSLEYFRNCSKCHKKNIKPSEDETVDICWKCKKEDQQSEAKAKYPCVIKNCKNKSYEEWRTVCSSCWSKGLRDPNPKRYTKK